MTTDNTFSNQKRDENNTFYKTNVANNVAQRNSQDLTEQWKKCELEIDKNYYLRFADGTEEIQLYIGAFLMRADNEVVEVLAPVPSYEEWQSLNELLDSMNDTNKALAHRLNICKELLKECREYVVNTPVYPQGDDNKQAEIHILVDKINEVLK